MIIFKRSAALFILLLIFSLCSVSAKEYLYKFKDNAEPPTVYSASLQGERDALASTLGIYKTDDIDTLIEYCKAGLLEFYEEDGEAELCDLPGTKDFMALVSGATSVVPLGHSYSQLGVDALWSLGLTGKGIRVAVIDSGANYHNDLADNLLEGYNYSLTDAEILENPDAVYVTNDIYRHGTMVSGLIAANGNHYRGIAYEAKIIPLKCFRDSDGKSSLSDLAEAVVDAIDKFDCDIINMSCGSFTNSQALKKAIEYANQNGVPVIAAAGNNGSSRTEKDADYYPASYSSVVSVANIDRYDVLKSSSQKNDMVDVAAPGTDIYGISGNSVNGYLKNSGTSFSCPMVTGIAALMLQAKPSLSDAEIQSLLCQTATDLGDAGKDVKYGYGKVNCAAIAPKLLDGKIYRSGVVDYKGSRNIVIRNGLERDITDFFALATYEGGKMTSISVSSKPIAFGESKVFSFSEGSRAKLFTLGSGGYMPSSDPLEIN